MTILSLFHDCGKYRLYTNLVGGMAQWLGRRCLAGKLSLA